MLVPQGHPYASKRPPIDTDYFETFNRDNVELVDIKKAPIVEVTPNGLRTRDREYEIDTLVFATGFDAMTDSLLRLNIRGTAGRTLEDQWVDIVNAAANMTLFMKADSWYVGANIPRKKRVFMPYVGGNVEYRRHCNESAKMGDAGFDLQGD